MGLLDLPIDVARLILNEFQVHELAPFRLTSRTCRLLSEPVVFRTLTLHDQSQVAGEMLAYIHDRLHDPCDDLRFYVRRLNIGPFKVYRPLDRFLVEVLNSLVNLNEISWNMFWPMEDGVFSLLTSKLTNVNIHVTTLERTVRGQNGPVFISMDTRLLSLPNLTSLRFKVYGNWALRPFPPRGDNPFFYSEFAELRSCLFQATGLRKLGLCIDEDVRLAHVERFWTAGPCNLGFDEGDTFPALEELCLEFEQYPFTEEHCHQWIQAMDWSQLRRLDLGGGCPPNFFAALTGNVPQLQALSFGFRPHIKFGGRWKSTTPGGSPSMASLWSCDDPFIVRRFWDSVDGLTELVVNPVSHRVFEWIWSSLLNKHGPTLRKFHLGASRNRRVVWKLDHVREIKEQCSRLQDLRINVAMDEEGTQYIWPDATTEELVKLPLLRHLGIEMAVDAHDSPEFVVVSNGHYTIVEEAVRTRLINLLTSIRSVQSKIDTVHLRFKLLKSEASCDFKAQRDHNAELGFLVERTSFGLLEIPWDHYI